MPSDMKGGRGRSAIVNYRVKAGNKDVYSHQTKFKCKIFIKENQKDYKEKLKLIPPNY
jgi:hypothetical protein